MMQRSATKGSVLLVVLLTFGAGLASCSSDYGSCGSAAADSDMLTFGKQNEKFRNATISRTPVRRWADPGEFGAVAAYLARRDLKLQTGYELLVDGGYTNS